MWCDRTEIALENKVFRNKNLGDTFLLFICSSNRCQNLGQSDKFHLSFSSLKCPLQVKKLI